MTRFIPKIVASLLIAGLSLTAQAQARLSSPGRGCGTTENNEAMQQQLERLIPGYDRNARPTPPAGSQRVAVQNYRIPVVFHVINNGEAVGTGTNIPDARILEQMDRLNVDFAKLNTDQGIIPAAFQPVHADVQVQFALAQRDLSGNCFNGIDRINYTTKGWTAPPYLQAYCNSTIKPGSFWDPTRYMNIWVMDLGGGLLGFAQFPDNTAGLAGLNASGGNANTDGVVILYSAIGNTTGAYNLGRTATHEVGHYLGLRHIWGDAACGDDFVGDTPTQNTSNYGCPAYPHLTCSNTTTGDQFMNYMDYVDDGCMQMFSEGQKSRVQAVMAANTPRRTSLNTSSALPPVATITATTSTPVVCAGSSIFLTGTAPTGYTFNWTGPNGFTSTQQNPSVANATTAASGTYTFTATPAAGCPVSDNVDVTVRPLTATPSLAASNGGLSCGTAPTLLTATPAGSQTATLINQNWNSGTQEAGWTLDNTSTSNQAGAVWATVTPATGGGVDGTRYIKVDANATTNSAQTRTSLYSPVFSATGVSTLSLTFQHVFVFATGDLGKVQITNNGGGTWTTLPAATYSANTGAVGNPATVTINLNTYAGQSGLQLRWNYSSNSGQSWSVDNMVVTGTVLNTFAWSLISGDGMPATPSTTNTLQVSPSQTSVYQVTVTAPNLCASLGTTVSVTVPTAVTWTGAAGDGVWTNVANWNPCVPTRVSSATIPNGLATPYPTITTPAEVASIVQNGPLTLSGGSLSLYGNHSGTGTFTQTGGTFVVAGTGAQSLRGLTYGNLTINGAGTKTLQGNATATAAATLTNGLLATGSYTLTLNATAALSETLTSYVLGRVAATGTVAGGGSSSFNGLGATIAAPNGSVAPGIIQAVRTTGLPISNPSLPNGLSIGRFFDLTPTVNSGLNLNLTLAYSPADLGGQAENLLFLYRALNAGASFSRFPRTLNTTSHLVTATAVDHLSVWTLAASNSPLPVELSAFSVAAAGPDARLSWTTASEKNNAYFEVQVSTNGSEFHAIGQVAGQGNSARATDYSLTDARLARYNASLLYYRLRQVDVDGTTSLSPVRTLAVGKGPETGLTAQLVPNPSNTADAAPQLFLAGPGAGAVTITLHDAVGRILSQRQVAVSGAGLLALPEAARLPAGVYVLEVQQAGIHLNVKLLRE